MEIEFSENNSGGSWWLTQEQYKELIKAGWKAGRKSYDDSIRSCTKEFDNLRDAILEWERITGEDASEEGCNCCGAPYSFSGDDEYCSGEDCLEYLYKENANLSKRELLKNMEFNFK